MSVLGFMMVSSGSLGLRVVQVVQGCQFQGFLGLGGRLVTDGVCRRVYRWLSNGVTARTVAKKVDRGWTVH